MSYTNLFRKSVYYQVVKQDEIHNTDKFEPLDVYFPKIGFKASFDCSEPTRFTQWEIVKKIKETTETIESGDDQTQLDFSAHLQVWGELLRKVAYENCSSEDIHDIVVWF